MHKTAFMMAYTLGAELVPAPVHIRVTFNSYFESNPFERVPMDTLLNAECISAYWSKRGMVVHGVGSPKRAINRFHLHMPQIPGQFCVMYTQVSDDIAAANSTTKAGHHRHHELKSSVEVAIIHTR